MFATLLLLSCARILAAPPLLEPACEWPRLVWDGPASLRLQETGEPFGWMHPGYGVIAAGTLGFDRWGQARFRGRFEADGITVLADVAPNEDGAATPAYSPRQFGPAMVAAGGMLQTLGTADGGLVVGPDARAADLLRGRDAWATLRCHEVILGQRVHSFGGAELLQAVGLPAPVAQRQLASGGRFALYDEPGGRRLGRLDLRSSDGTLQVLEERDGWAWVALAHWTGTV